MNRPHKQEEGAVRYKRKLFVNLFDFSILDADQLGVETLAEVIIQMFGVCE